MCEDIQRGGLADRRYSSSGSEVLEDRTRDARRDSYNLSHQCLSVLLGSRCRMVRRGDARFPGVDGSEGVLGPPMRSADDDGESFVEVVGAGAGLVADISDLRSPNFSSPELPEVQKISERCPPTRPASLSSLPSSPFFPDPASRADLCPFSFFAQSSSRLFLPL